MNRRNLPATENSLGCRVRVRHPLAPLAEGQVIDVAYAQVMRRVLTGYRFVEAPVVLVLHGAVTGAVSVFSVRTGDELAPSVRGEDEEALVEPVFKTGFEGMECRVAVVLASGVAVDVTNLRNSR